MASSRATTKPFSRRFKWLGAVILIVIALYTAGWFALARFIETQIGDALAQAASAGTVAECANAEARGYPFRIGLFCDSLRFEDEREGVRFSTGAFRSAAQIYDPAKLVGELDGPAAFVARGLPSLDFSWEVLRASSRLASPIPAAFSAETRQLRVMAGSQTSLAQIAFAEAHFRTRDSDVDLAARFQDLQLDAGITQGRSIPPVSGEADLAIVDGVSILSTPSANGRPSLRGRSGELRTLKLTTQSGAGATLSGPWSVDEIGLVDATLSITLIDPKGLSEVLSQSFPQESGQIRTVLSNIGSIAGTDGETPPFPIRITKGEMTAMFFSLGRLPPID